MISSHSGIRVLFILTVKNDRENKLFGLALMGCKTVTTVTSGAPTLFWVRYKICHAPAGLISNPRISLTGYGTFRVLKTVPRRALSKFAGGL